MGDLTALDRLFDKEEDEEEEEEEEEQEKAQPVKEVKQKKVAGQKKKATPPKTRFATRSSAQKPNAAPQRVQKEDEEDEEDEEVEQPKQQKDKRDDESSLKTTSPIIESKSARKASNKRGRKTSRAAASSPSSDEFEVSKIVAKRKIGNGTQYLVNWKGYGEAEATWESYTNLKVNCLDLITAFEAQQKRLKKEAKKRGEVFTPPAVVDQKSVLSPSSTWRDSNEGVEFRSRRLLFTHGDPDAEENPSSLSSSSSSSSVDDDGEKSVLHRDSTDEAEQEQEEEGDEEETEDEDENEKKVKRQRNAKSNGAVKHTSVRTRTRETTSLSLETSSTVQSPSFAIRKANATVSERDSKSPPASPSALSADASPVSTRLRQRAALPAPQTSSPLSKTSTHQSSSPKKSSSSSSSSTLSSSSSSSSSSSLLSPASFKQPSSPLKYSPRSTYASPAGLISPAKTPAEKKRLAVERKKLIQKLASEEIQSQAQLFKELDTKELVVESPEPRATVIDLSAPLIPLSPYTSSSSSSSPSTTTTAKTTTNETTAGSGSPKLTSYPSDLTPIRDLQKLTPAYRAYQAVIGAVTDEPLTPSEFYSHHSQSSS